MNALRRRLPSSLRTGMLWRLGRSDDSRPVRATVWSNVAWMRPSAATSASRRLAVGGAQLLHLAVAEQGVDDRVLAAQLLQGGRVGGEPRLGLAPRGEPEPVVEHRAQLRCRVDVEGLAGELVDHGFEAGALGDEPLGDPAQLLGVDAHAGDLHAGQHPHQGPLHLVVQAVEAGLHEGVAHGREQQPQRHGVARRQRGELDLGGASRASWPAASASTSASSASPSCTSTTSSRR